MADPVATLRHHEVEMAVEHSRAMVALLAAVEELRSADTAMPDRACWGWPASRYLEAVARVQVAQEAVNAFAAFEPGAWL